MHTRKAALASRRVMSSFALSIGAMKTHLCVLTSGKAARIARVSNCVFPCLE